MEKKSQAKSVTMKIRRMEMAAQRTVKLRHIGNVILLLHHPTAHALPNVEMTLEFLKKHVNMD